jgi:signal transduction histidine kinase
MERERPRTGLPSQLLHDLRSPLNQIIGYSEMLSEDADAQTRDVLIADLEKIRLAGHRILSLLEENFSGISEDSADISLAPEEDDRPAAVTEHVVEPGLVLVVDDDETNRDVLSRRLRRQGHIVRTASNGRDALVLIRESTFDLVLLDIMMPEMDGYAVLARMKADPDQRNVPVIMISALSEVQTVVRCIEAGAEDYLTKPFDPILLKARIGACLEKKRGRDRETVLFDQLKKNYRRLQELEKLRDDMRNMIVHDLRTPLTGVIVGVEMLEKYGALNATQREMMTIAVGGGKTLLGMINDLLDVEKMESGTTQLNYEQLVPAALVAASIEQVRVLAEQAETVIATEIAPGLPVMAGDASKLSRTLVNLLANAIKFTHAGTVTVSVSHKKGMMRYAVRDTGNGIPAEALDRIFEKFAQVDPGSKVGTGLGLAFCKLAVEAHGGQIGVESKTGEGSTFWFTVPVVAPSG